MEAVPESESTALQMFLANLQTNFKVTSWGFLWLVNAYLQWSGCGKGFVVLAEHEKMILFKSHIPSKNLL